MKILVIGGLSTDPQDVESLCELKEFLSDGFATISEVETANIDRLIFDFAPDGECRLYEAEAGIDAADYDVLFIRGPKMRILSELAFYVTGYAELTGKSLVNGYGRYYPGTKVAQTIMFRKHDAQFLRTLYTTDKRRLITEAERVFGYPYVLKTNVGSHGDSNYLVKSIEDADRILRDEPEVDFLAQSYCPNDRDYRLLLVGKHELTFERKGNDDSHINNTSKGGQATPVEGLLPSEIYATARAVAEDLQFDIAGVDIMPNRDTGELYFLEINSQPQLRTGALLDEKKKLLEDYFADKSGRGA